jgi:hypothetical protein
MIVASEEVPLLRSQDQTRGRAATARSGRGASGADGASPVVAPPANRRRISCRDRRRRSADDPRQAPSPQAGTPSPLERASPSTGLSEYGARSTGLSRATGRSPVSSRRPSGAGRTVPRRSVPRRSAPRRSAPVAAAGRGAARFGGRVRDQRTGAASRDRPARERRGSRPWGQRALRKVPPARLVCVRAGGPLLGWTEMSRAA